VEAFFLGGVTYDIAETRVELILLIIQLLPASLTVLQTLLAKSRKTKLDFEPTFQFAGIQRKMKCPAR
jgi:hypothetical protein